MDRLLSIADGSLVASASFCKNFCLSIPVLHIDSVCFHRNTRRMLFFSFGDQANCRSLQDFFSAAIIPSARV